MRNAFSTHALIPSTCLSFSRSSSRQIWVVAPGQGATNGRWNWPGKGHGIHQSLNTQPGLYLLSPRDLHAHASWASTVYTAWWYLQGPHSLAFNWPLRDSTERIFNLVVLQKHWFTLHAGFLFPLQVCVTDSKTKKGYVINYLTSAWLRRQRICYASFLLFRLCQDSKLCVSLGCLHSCFIFPHMVWQISTADRYGRASGGETALLRQIRDHHGGETQSVFQGPNPDATEENILKKKYL